MSDTSRDRLDDSQVQPLRDGDTSIEADPAADPAQAEWEATEAGIDPDEVIATGDDPAHLPSPDDEIPAEDLHHGDLEPDTQNGDPLLADLGEDGQGDLAPEDL